MLDAGLWDVVEGITALLPAILLICCMFCPEEEEDADTDRAAARSALHAHPRPPAPVRTTPAVKRALGYFAYSASVKGGGEGNRASGERLVCAICLEVFLHGATCSEVPACRHLFHRDCIAPWMRSKSTCPLCRVRIVTGSEPLSAAEDMV